MLTRDELSQDRELCHAKALGCLAGLAIGDTLGDLGRTESYRQRYGILTSLPAGANGTDDTEFALLTARTLLDYDGEITPESVLRSWQKYILDEGGVYQRGGRLETGPQRQLAGPGDGAGSWTILYRVWRSEQRTFGAAE